jgi:RNA polymerase sigma factor (TIGR02999 family)
MAHKMRVGIVESVPHRTWRVAYHGSCLTAFGTDRGGNLTEIGSLITSADRGEAGASEALFTALYAELHRLARRELAKNGYATLGTTTLLHEAYLDISGRAGAVFPDRARFLAYASRVMRGLIISYVRNRQAQKRGGRFELTTIGDGIADMSPNGHGLERLSDALDELAATEPDLRRSWTSNSSAAFRCARLRR